MGYSNIWCLSVGVASVCLIGPINLGSNVKIMNHLGCLYKMRQSDIVVDLHRSVNICVYQLQLVRIGQAVCKQRKWSTLLAGYSAMSFTMFEVMGDYKEMTL